MKRPRQIFAGIAVFAAATLVLFTPQPAYADWFGFDDIAASVVGKLAFFVSYLVGLIGGVVIMFEIWVLQILLHIGSQIINSPVVKNGFPVTLAVANLTFVLGIIVVAIMTIVRSQTYGMKQILWKLIVMAILINFGLVIAGPILGFADGLTSFFLNSIDPGKGEDPAASMKNFASAIAGALNPQKGVVVTKESIDKNRGEIKELSGAFTSGASFGKLVTPLVSVFFSMWTVLIMVIVLGALVIMMAIRYVYIGILLVLLPLAWASWVFPSFRQYNEKWWNKFLSQAFFAPAVVFFLWLALMTSKGMAGMIPEHLTPALGRTDGVLGALSQFFTGLFSGILTQAMQAFIIVGIMVGGLIVAQTLGIHFASAAIGAAKGASKAFGGYVGRRGTGGVARRLTTPPPERKGWRNALQKVNPMHWLRKGAQSGLVKKTGVTRELAAYGARTSGGQNVRKRAEALLKKAKDPTLSPEEAERTKREGLDLMATAEKQAMENPNLMRSLLAGAGLVKAKSPGFGNVSTEELKKQGFDASAAATAEDRKRIEDSEVKLDSHEGRRALHAAGLANMGITGTKAEQAKAFSAETAKEKTRVSEERQLADAERKKALAISRKELAENRRNAKAIEQAIEKLKAEGHIEGMSPELATAKISLAEAFTKQAESEAKIEKGLAEALESEAAEKIALVEKNRAERARGETTPLPPPPPPSP